MKLNKFLLHDIKCDAISKYQYLLLGVILSLITHVEVYNKLSSVKIKENLDGNGSFVDYWVCLIQGKSDYKFSIGDLYEFPTYWFLLFVFLLIPICIYTWDDLSGYGQQLIVRAKSRSGWLMSKYVWAGSVVVLYFLLLIGTTLLFCLCENVDLSMHPTWYVMELYGSSVIVDFSVWKIMVIYFLQPLLLMFLFCCLEITLLLYIPKAIAFLCTGGLLIVSLYKKSYFLIGNLGIPIRMDKMDENGLSFGVCIFMMIILSVAMIVLGNIRINKKDIL